MMSSLRSWSLVSALCIAALGCDTGGGGGTDDGSDDDVVTPSDGVPSIPQPSGACPTLQNGSVQFAGKAVQLWVGPAGKKGPLLLYWHATGMTYTEVQTGFSSAISEVQKSGGVVASFAETTSEGTNTGNGVWYTGDFKIADQVVACAVQQGLVDPQRIHTSGFSAGGLQCGAMIYQRSGYLASALCLSGGIISIMGSSTYKLQDPSNVPPVIAAHGAAGSDVIVVDFASCSADLCADVVKKGGFAVECNDGGDHVMSMMSRSTTMAPVGWRFFKAHPFGVKPYPYAAGLPDYFPDDCKITK